MLLRPETRARCSGISTRALESTRTSASSVAGIYTNGTTTACQRIASLIYGVSPRREFQRGVAKWTDYHHYDPPHETTACRPHLDLPAIRSFIGFPSAF
jgi:hypothetical protein